MKPLYKSLAVLTLALNPFASDAAIYGYHPESRLYLGGGFNPYLPANGYIRCIEHNGEEAVDTQGAASSDINISLVTSREDLYQKINFSASMAGSYGVFSGGGSIRIEDERAFHSDSLTWIILFKTDYGRFVLKNPRLKKAYTKVSDQELYQSCGSEIVTEQRKSVLVYALLTVNHLSESRRREMEASFSASASSGIWSAKMDSQYKSILQTAMAANNITVRVNAIGGRGITDLSGMIGAGGDNPYIAYENLPTVLKKYIDGMTADNAVATQYVTTPVSSFKRDVQVRYNDFNSLHIGRLYNMYQDSFSIVNRLRSILSGSSGEHYQLTDEERNELSQALMKHEKSLNVILRAAQKCFVPDNNKCSVPNVRIPVVRWPLKSQPAEYCEGLRRMAYDRGLVEENFIKIARQRNFVPRIEGNSITEWVHCDDLN